jgi:excisionase family DNA binding protein
MGVYPLASVMKRGGILSGGASMKSPKTKQSEDHARRAGRRGLPLRHQQLLEAKEAAQLLKAQEAAEFLNVSVNTIRMWVWQKRLPVVRLGRAVRLRREDLEQFIERNREDAISF